MKVIVEIDLPELTTEHFESGDFVQAGQLVLDEAYLPRHLEDDSFFVFRFLGAREA